MIASHDLLHHDRRILDRLASKRVQDIENEFKARTFHQKWTEEFVQWRKNKQNYEHLWQKELMAKRKLESDTTEQKLKETKERLNELHTQLSKLMEEKQQKADQLVTRARRYIDR